MLARISQLAAHSGQLSKIDVHIDVDTGTSPHFTARTEFLFDPQLWPRTAMDREFAALGSSCGATRATLRVETDAKPRMAVLVSKVDHCLNELLHRWEAGELDVDVSCVISNHARDGRTYVRRFLERKNVPLFYVPASGPARPDQLRSHEPAMLSLVSRNSDFIVLARCA